MKASAPARPSTIPSLPMPQSDREFAAQALAVSNAAAVHLTQLAVRNHSAISGLRGDVADLQRGQADLIRLSHSHAPSSAAFEGLLRDVASLRRAQETTAQTPFATPHEHHSAATMHGLRHEIGYLRHAHTDCILLTADQVGHIHKKMNHLEVKLDRIEQLLTRLINGSNGSLSSRSAQSLARSMSENEGPRTGEHDIEQ